MFYSNFVRQCAKIGKSPSAALVEAGISKPMASRWKSGTMPTDATIAKLADYFGITVEELKAYEETKKDTAQKSDVMDIETLFRSLNHLSSTQLLEVSERVNEVLKSRL